MCFLGSDQNLCGPLPGFSEIFESKKSLYPPKQTAKKSLYPPKLISKKSLYPPKWTAKKSLYPLKRIAKKVFTPPQFHWLFILA